MKSKPWTLNYFTVPVETISKHRRCLLTNSRTVEIAFAGKKIVSLAPNFFCARPSHLPVYRPNYSDINLIIWADPNKNTMGRYGFLRIAKSVLAVNTDQTSTIDVTCTNTTPYNIGLEGLNGGSVTTRQMKSAGPVADIQGSWWRRIRDEVFLVPTIIPQRTEGASVRLHATQPCRTEPVSAGTRQQSAGR